MSDPPSPERAPTEPSKEALKIAHQYLEIPYEWRIKLAEDIDRFRAAGVREERERCFTWAIGRIPRSRAIRAIREGESPGEVYVPRDPSLCWRCGVTLHPGHDCSEAFP